MIPIEQLHLIGKNYKKNYEKNKLNFPSDNYNKDYNFKDPERERKSYLKLLIIIKKKKHVNHKI